MKSNRAAVIHRLFRNSRFWILTFGLVLSVIVAGVTQMLLPSGSLQEIRLQQVYGFISITLLFIALLASPLTKTYPKLPFKDGYLHARRAIGVLTFYYALLHASIAFFRQLGGFSGVQYYTADYKWSLLLGCIALVILMVMAMTSIDWAVNFMGFNRWKLLHRFVYLAGIGVLIHVVLIGSHYDGFGVLSGLTAVGLVILLWFQLVRIKRNFTGNNKDKSKSGAKKYVLLLGLLVLFGGQQTASAHVLKADSDVGAILHIYPDDNPVSGRPVDYILSFQDITNRFSLLACDCKVTYKADGEVIDTKPLNTSFDTDSKNTFTFPEPAIYTIEVSGKPIPGADFEPFELTYTVRVSSGDIEAQDIPPILLVGISAAIGLVVLGAYVMDSGNKTSNKKPNKRHS